MRTINVLIVEPNKKARFQEIECSLESYQKIVDGYIECAYLIPEDDDMIIVCNEEGKFTEQLNRGIVIDDKLVDIIAGTFFVCGGGNSDDFESLSNDQLDIAMKKFGNPHTFFNIDGKIHLFDY